MNNKAALMVFPFALLASSPSLARTDYAFCLGGGRANLFYSSVFPVVQGATKDADRSKAFNAFVKTKYGITIFAECHSDLTQALGASDKKMREDSDQHSKFPSKLIETGWVGK